MASRCGDAPHHPEEVGHSGVVHGERVPSSALRHPYIVVFDPPVPRVIIGLSLVPLPVRHYAVDELEPIADPA